MQHRVRHPGERGGVQRQPPGRRDLLRRHASLDSQGVGILSYLPLHASGHHDDTTIARPQPRTVLDRVISSYTTTVRGLSYARAQHPDPAADSVLIVAVTAAPGTGTLEGAAAEAGNLARLIPRAQILPDPTRQTVLDSLPAEVPRGFRTVHPLGWMSGKVKELPRPKKSFSPEFKDEAVKMVIETSRPIARVAKELGINEGTLGNWVGIYRREHAGEEPALTVNERARLRELERETRELKMENDFLKKAAAYFAKDHR